MLPQYPFTILFTLVFLFGSLGLSAQPQKTFAEDKPTFLKEFREFMTASKVKTLEEAYKNFEAKVKANFFSEQEFAVILSTCKLQREKGMGPSPYFKKYLQTLESLKINPNAPDQLLSWHDLYRPIVEEIENRNFKEATAVLDFTITFFNQKALKYSSIGVSWYVESDQFQFASGPNGMEVRFDTANIKAERKSDFIRIEKSKGIYYPALNKWEGSGGTVSWDRTGLKDTYAKLGTYTINTTSTGYVAEDVKFFFPEMFNERIITGTLEDKISTAKRPEGVAFPRFSSVESSLQIENFGEGVVYDGGFRIEGKTVYGNSQENAEATIFVYDKAGKLKFKALSRDFFIRKEDRIAGQSVRMTLFFDQDSIYHPSVNIKYNIKNQILNLSRGQSGTDRNPFFNSYHKVNIDVETIDWFIERDSIVLGSPGIGFQSTNEAQFESLRYFEPSDYRRLQNISTKNPIATFKLAAIKEGSRQIPAFILARELNPKYGVENIQGLLFEMVEKGFINYDTETKMVEIKDKIFHYADANQKKVDYDIMLIKSQAKKEANGTLLLDTDELVINDVSSIELSNLQKVGITPFGDQVILKKNRNMFFHGKIFAGRGIIDGKHFHFDYDRFHIVMDSIRYFDLYLPTEEKDRKGNPVTKSIGSTLEHLEGTLLIDAPSNKSGTDDIPFFPSFNSHRESYVYYDKPFIQEGVYTRDSFYFRLDPFHLNGLDNLEEVDLAFKGNLISYDIFPDIEETLIYIEEDQSLGFFTKTPDDGFPNYAEKGQYTGEIGLSNKGLLGQGTLKYLASTVDAVDFAFRPKQLTASAKRFDLVETRIDTVEFPQVFGPDVKIDWRPYQDSMYITTQDKPFEMYKAPGYLLKGTLIMTPDGVKAKGELDWPKGNLKSDVLLSFGTFSVQTDTAALKIKALDNPDAIALSNNNVQGDIDFDKLFGSFRANIGSVATELPYNKYKTTMNAFDWDIKNQSIIFQADENELAGFTSTDPTQDSLYFEGESASYDLKNSSLKIGGVPYIISCQAFIYPDSGKVNIESGGLMTQLKNTRIVADTQNQYHVITRADIQIKGKKSLEGKGYYQYNIPGRDQEILFNNIVGKRVGKGARSKREAVTSATGEVTEENEFFIDRKTQFFGTISLNAALKELQFDGYARLDAPKMPLPQWFRVNSLGDKNDLTIKYDLPKDQSGANLYNGIFLSGETGLAYPRIMMPLFFRKDRSLTDVRGIFTYDEDRDVFMFGDSTKILTNSLVGKKLEYFNADGQIQYEGPLNLGSGLLYPSIKAAGQATIFFQEFVEEDSTTLSYPGLGKDLRVSSVAGVNFILPDKLWDIVSTDFKSSAFDAPGVGYRPKNLFIRSFSEILPEGKSTENTLRILNGEDILSIEEKNNPFDILFSRLQLTWSADLQSFINTEDRVGLASIKGTMINRMIKGYVEIRMPSNGDDRLYMYLQSPSGFFYFFGYKQGILTTVSDNPKYNDAVLELKKKELFIKMADGNFYEIQPGNIGNAKVFKDRVISARE